MADVQQREVPEQLVLTEQRVVPESEIKGWLMDSMDRLHKSSQGLDGMTGPYFVVYHGQFTEDTPEVPVEVCAPIGLDKDGIQEVATRREPAHREAYLRLKKSQFQNPAEIGAAFGAVAQWVAENGFTIADAPREVYFTDFQAAADDDEVCDIAFPIQ
ncbi:GyrI-like domain-containing protein [Amycolatopsis anabasis]|uniref:GyrI-like domain-containing protein n=1 Tax=Amycolatopsis anabasis TaxID=1840409 RepID=UPI00131A7272|nr:GyrI-like domain-containing protein [Amycolatopsis anabasis]